MDNESPLQRIVKNSNLIRKSLAAAQQIPRTYRRMICVSADYDQNPPVLANSFPKSGTHLLLQILKRLPDVKHYGTFIASMPSITFRERSSRKHVQIIDRIIPGEAVPAHLFYQDAFEKVLQDKNVVHYFIYRDPRDVVISEAHYLARMNKWHRMHSYFASKQTLENQISLAITGVDAPDFPYDYPNVAERFSCYRGWLECPHVLSLKYEDLTSSRRREHLQRIVHYYADYQDCYLDINKIVDKMERCIQPEKSHTFRSGEVGDWRNTMTPENIQQMKEIAGSLIIDLGYEKDLNWSTEPVPKH